MCICIYIYSLMLSCLLAYLPMTQLKPTHIVELHLITSALVCSSLLVCLLPLVHSLSHTHTRANTHAHTSFERVCLHTHTHRQSLYPSLASHLTQNHAPFGCDPGWHG